MVEVGFYNWISADPLVLFHSAVHKDDVGMYLPNKRIYRIVFNLWYHSADQIESYHKHWTAQKPLHRFLHLVNERSICVELVARGVPAIFVNQNCFLDENLYSVQSEVEKKHDAVYIARMSSFKRHHLLEKTASPLIIGGLINADDTVSYFESVRAALPNATFTHDPPTLQLSPAQVSAHVNSARVGVCLSQQEGAMYACTEYMLCGLAVVSTPNQGGRDAWLDPAYSRVVPPDPSSIATAVRELSELDISPIHIRAAVVAEMTEHRNRFLHALQGFYRAEGIGRDCARDLLQRV